MRTAVMRRFVAPLSMIAAATLVLAGCTTSSDAEGGNGSTEKDSVTYALPAGTGPNWILPISSPEGNLKFLIRLTKNQKVFRPERDFCGASGIY